MENLGWLFKNRSTSDAVFTKFKMDDLRWTIQDGSFKIEDSRLRIQDGWFKMDDLR